MNRSGKKKIALLLAVSLLLGLLAGCGKKEDGTQQLSATVYVPKYLDMNIDADYITDGCSDGENLYLIGESDETVTQPGTGEDGIDEYSYMRSIYSIYRVSLADGSVEVLPDYVGPSVPEGKEGNCSVNQIAVGDDGSIWVTEQVYVWGDMNWDGKYDGGDVPVAFDSAMARAESSAEPEEAAADTAEDDAGIDTGDVEEPLPAEDESYETLIRRQLDQTGNELSRIDMSSLEEMMSGVMGEDEYINNQAFDSSGNFYVSTDKKIYALNNDMSVRFSVEGEDMYYELLSLGGGLMGMQNWEYDDATETSTNKLKTLDPEKQDWGPEYILPNNAYSIYPGGGDYLFYYQISDSIFGFKAGEPDENGMGTGTGEKLFSWLEADINNDNVRKFFFLPDGRVAAVLQEWDQNYENMTNSVVVMTATPRSELPEKTTLVYATLYLNYDAKNKILDFNKKSETHRIEVKDYAEYNEDGSTDAALQKLNTEILAGNVPDILDTTSLPVRQYGAKGILEDLWPFIDNDPDLGRDKLMIRPLEANQQDGKLYELFGNFSIRSAAGATSVVGDRTSWTLADLQAALATMPEGCAIFGEGDTKSNMLSTLISLNMDQFVNWDKGECSFDSPDFKAMLEFCNSFPAEFDWEDVNWDEWEEEEARVMSGKQLLLQQYIYNFEWSLQRTSAIFKGDYSYVGFPKEDGSCGSSFRPDAGVAMTSACKDKDGAWSFIREMLLPQYQDGNYFGNFPINKADFDMMVNQTLENRWVTDENGDPELDENGEKIPIDYGTMWISEDVEIPLGPVEQADIDKVMDLYNNINSIYRYDENIMESVNEVAGQYFAGDKPLDEAASLIQNKVKLYMGENM